MKKLMSILGILSLIFSSTAMAEECKLPEKNACKMVKIKAMALKKEQENLAKMESLQDQLLEATRLRDQLIERDNPLEIENAEEDLINEMALIAESNGGEIKKGVASVGGILLFGYIIKRMNKSTKGQNLKARLIGHLFTKDKAFIRLTVNGAFLFSLASSFYVGYRLYDNHKRKLSLKEVIEKLNQLKDQTNQLITLREEVEELQICYEFNLEELIELGLAKLEDDKLECL